MLVDFISPVLEKCFSLELKQEGKPSSESHFLQACRFFRNSSLNTFQSVALTHFARLE